MKHVERSIFVLLTFDLDAIAGWISDGATSLGPISRGEFDVVGARRLLELMDGFGIRSTFFVPGHTAETYPDIVREIAARGHEIGHHGWMHENPAKLSESDERDVIKRGLASLEEVTGTRVEGYRAPYWDLSPNSTRLLVEYGFVYDSSLMGGDFTPYWCRTGDRLNLDGPYEFGETLELVELPVAWHLDDVPLFDIVLTEAVSFTGLRPPSEVFELWSEEFDYLFENFESGMLNLTMHPQVIGRGHRMAMLRRLIEYMQSRPGISFTTCLDYAKNWRSANTPGVQDES